MKYEHTPGPWKWSEDRSPSVSDAGERKHYVGTAYPPGQLCDRSRSIAVMTGSYLTREDRPEPERSEVLTANRANARLIAAAPDLLEACRYAERELDSAIRSGVLGETWTSIQCALADAIAKATNNHDAAIDDAEARTLTFSATTDPGAFGPTTPKETETMRG